MATETVMSVLLSDPPPVLVAPALLRGLGLTDREPPAWIADPDLRESIKAGFVDLPDWEAP
ncbi:hypothetical protein OG594_08680 [Streptomyces sp. NBC_01214]|uniref:hypothetical protein n=1 Tax=Streptomyces sp. NBC_01214 TaxID=2903777 RepID=UPI00225B1705|nr:hypothetical protein [Streptomyces sp. NBC_01214]MCX4801724.1 hypothetical protein [Streptomyces sp. NBC_01214]